MRPLVILKLLFQKLFLVLVGPLQLLLLLLIFLLELQFPGICRPLLRLQDLIHLQPESLDLLLRLRLRVLDLLADRRMRLLDLLSGFLLRRADLLPRPLLLHPGRVLRLRDLQIRRLAYNCRTGDICRISAKERCSVIHPDHVAVLDPLQCRVFIGIRAMDTGLAERIISDVLRTEFHHLLYSCR